MKVRETGYLDYGMTGAEAKEWLEKCQCADKDMDQLIFQAAQESNEVIAADLYYSLRTGISYNALFSLRYIPVPKVDFYGYRRKALFLLKEKVIQNNDVVQKYFVDTGNIRRFLSTKSAGEELQLTENMTLRMARKANAVVKFGCYNRIDMTKLYAYIDGQTGERADIDEIEQQKGYGDHDRKEPDSGNSVQQDGTF